jgi:hypothetical protein
MSYRIVISSLAAIVIGMSCIATDASARGGGGGSGGGGGGRSGGAATGIHSSFTGPTGGGRYFAAPGAGRFAAPGVSRMPPITGMGGHVYHRLTGVLGPGGPTVTPRIIGVGDPTGAGVAAGALYYAPEAYNSHAACGHYPYPPCKMGHSQ